MNQHYEARLKEARDISDKLKDISDAVVIVGSVAYNPAVVHEKTDLDMVVVLNSHYPDVCRRLGTQYDPVIDEICPSKANIFTMNFNKEFPVGISFWDSRDLLYDIAKLSGDNGLAILREPGFNRISESEILHSLTGKTFQCIGKDEYKDRIIQNIPICARYYDEEDNLVEFCTGVPVTNLLLNPTILYQKEGLISSSQARVKNKLSQLARRAYSSRKGEASFEKSLPEKIQKQVPAELIKEINTVLFAQ